MPSTPASVNPILYSFPSGDALIDSLAKFIVRVQKEAIDKKGRFTIALSGGSLPKQLRGLVGQEGIKWDKWHDILFFYTLRNYVYLQFRNQACLLCG